MLMLNVNNLDKNVIEYNKIEVWNVLFNVGFDSLKTQIIPFTHLV